MKKLILLLTLIISTFTLGATLSEGTLLTVSNDTTISSQSPVGSIIPFTLQGALMLSDGKVIPVGTRLFGKIISANRGGRLHGKSSVAITLDMIQIDGFNESIATNSLELVGRSEGKSTAGTMVRTTALGGLAGAFTHDVGKGAGIGAALGLAGSMLSKGEVAGANPGTLYDFTTTVNIQLNP